jgi:16S rRNA (guanine966-N2)-methyltransferase
MLRITGGLFGGRKIHTPPEGTRPSHAKLRQALYNSLQVDVPGARVLDLYAGAGTLGLEALSRGAESVVFLEASKSVCKLLERNVRELEVESQSRVYCEKVDKSARLLEDLAAQFGLFDLVVADPPYASGVELDLVNGAWWSWDRILASGGKLVLEWGRTKSRFTELPTVAPFLEKVREKTYGDSILTTYVRSTAGSET